MGGDGGKQIPSDRHHALKESSLLLHDVQTGGIPGLLLPCAEMPVKFTDNLCREEKIFKHTMVRLKEIASSAAIAEQVQQRIWSGLCEQKSGQRRQEPTKKRRSMVSTRQQRLRQMIPQVPLNGKAIA